MQTLATLQRVSDIIQPEVRWKPCLVHIDDVVIFFENLLKHVKDSDEVLVLLHQAKVTLKIPKCHFS